MLKRSISGRLALMFVLSIVLIIATLGLLLRSSLHDSLQKQMHNELLFRQSLMSSWITARTRLRAGQYCQVNLRFSQLGR